MLSKDLETTLSQAFKSARSRRHEFMTVEHLLLALADNEAAVKVLLACGANLTQLKGELKEFVEATTPRIPDDDAERDQTTHFQHASEEGEVLLSSECHDRQSREE